MSVIVYPRKKPQLDYFERRDRMNRTLLWGLAAVCNFVSAALTYQDNGRPLIIGIQLLAGVLMVVAAVKFRR
jgi:uncharacterized membrane protein